MKKKKNLVIKWKKPLSFQLGSKKKAPNMVKSFLFQKGRKNEKIKNKRMFPLNERKRKIKKALGLKNSLKLTRVLK